MPFTLLFIFNHFLFPILLSYKFGRLLSRGDNCRLTIFEVQDGAVQLFLYEFRFLYNDFFYIRKRSI